jgi:UDP-2,3-diacylglucosamine pyrophosphatase LpxH
MVSQTCTGKSQPVRTLFLSDVHLGSRHSQTDALLEFLGRWIPSHVYLVGDILDGWQWRPGCWKSSYSRILNTFEYWADRGATIHYTPGNHDAFLRDGDIAEVVKRQLGFIEIQDEFQAELRDGRKFLVMHGDQFDCVEGSAQWLSRLSTALYDSVLTANWYLSEWFSRSHSSPYDLCARGKKRVKQVIRFLSGFESSILNYTREKGCSGVVCGHLHTPAMFQRGDLTYCNTGDWVENCTALIEHDDGQLSLEHFYTGERRPRARRVRCQVDDSVLPHLVAATALMASATPNARNTGAA